MKVQRACETDSSVPDFVGAQVDEWLKELKEPPKDTKDE
jgi:hypothetical protein